MRITLCIVARSAPQYLRACLAGAAGVADEVVVVVTEMADRTAAAARATPVRLVTATRPGDLAHARNLGIEAARGDWILALHDDELIDPAERRRIRRLAASRRFDGFWSVYQHYSYIPTTKWRLAVATSPLSRGALGFFPSKAVALVRRASTYRYTGPSQPDVSTAILDGGGRIGDRGPLLHSYELLRIGHASWATEKALRRRLAEEPHDTSAWVELGLLFTGRLQHRRALLAFQRAQEHGGGPWTSFLVAESWLALNEPNRAIPLLRRALRANRFDRIIEFDRADVLTTLGLAHEAAKRPRQAEHAYRQALTARPEHPAARNNLAAMMAERGACAEALHLLERMRPAYIGLAHPWATLGTTKWRQGEVDQARAAFRCALDINPQNRSALVNLARLDSAGAPESVRHDRPLEQKAGRASHEQEHALRTPTPTRRHSPGGAAAPVVSFIAHLAGGAGRVLVDVVQALPHRRHIVLCGATDAFMGLGLTEELAAAGADVQAIASRRDITSVIRAVHPDLVIHHWWPNPIMTRPLRCRDERWVAYGHGCQPMPHGYDAYVAVSEYHAGLQRHLAPQKVHEIANAVDTSRYLRRSRRRGPVTIVMLSRLDAGKFPRRLLDFLPALGGLGACLLIAGRGRRRFEIEPELRQRRFADAVRFVGAIPCAGVPQFLAGAHVGLHLTEAVEESGSVAVKEMMAAGLPVVAQPDGCLPELIEPGQNGFLDDDENVIRRHLRELIVSPPLRRRMGAIARRRAQRYDLSHFRDAIARLADG